jgi:hypothetical protein
MAGTGSEKSPEKARSLRHKQTIIALDRRQASNIHGRLAITSVAVPGLMAA